MMEEPEHAFPPIEEEESPTTVNHTESEKPEVIQEEPEEEIVVKQITEDAKTSEAIVEELEECADEHPVDSAQFVASSSTGSDGETTGPSTAENSVSQAHSSVDISEPKQVVGGRASIPDELEPHQLARLQDLKESNA